MPVDYETIMATNFQSLKDAAEEWKTMSTKFSRLQKSYQRNISKHLEGAWEGYASVQFTLHSRNTQEEY